MNAMNHEILSKMVEAFEDIRSNDDVWMGIITGAGKAFSAGHDLSESPTRGKGPKAFMEKRKPVWKARQVYPEQRLHLII